MGNSFSMDRLAQESQERGVGGDKTRRLFFFKISSFHSMGPDRADPTLTTVVADWQISSLTLHMQSLFSLV